MNKFYLIGIGYRPLNEKASGIIRSSDVILTTARLFEVFKRYREFEDVKSKLKVTANINETIAFIRGNYDKENISVLADGDPMFFGFGKLILNEFDKGTFDIFPDLSSLQVAFSKIKEPWGDSFLISLHGGPDPANRRKLEHETSDIPHLLENYHKIGILTDKENNPAKIAGILNLSPLTSPLSIIIYVCERLGYPDEKITEGTPEAISAGAFSYPNVVIILKK
ncbi:MAG: precorrin-6y C5,15-methyltransferase (decarboxylating) subunit CbiE [Nitrospirae bacterium]|nr:precorrin-6y C5,15-methyltransferase (decarboxylating) subunit CbiE [Nitrospirota bacterium]